MFLIIPSQLVFLKKKISSNWILDLQEWSLWPDSKHCDITKWARGVFLFEMCACLTVMLMGTKYLHTRAKQSLGFFNWFSLRTWDISSCCQVRVRGEDEVCRCLACHTWLSCGQTADGRQADRLNVVRFWPGRIRKLSNLHICTISLWNGRCQLWAQAGTRGTKLGWWLFSAAGMWSRFPYWSRKNAGGNKVKHVFALRAVHTLPGLSGMAVGVSKTKGSWVSAPWRAPVCSGNALPVSAEQLLPPQPNENWEIWARHGLVMQEHIVSWMIHEAWVYLGKQMDSRASQKCHWLLMIQKEETNCSAPPGAASPVAQVGPAKSSLAGSWEIRPFQNLPVGLNQKLNFLWNRI